jgi:AraC-like DNA-binding protein
MLDRIGAIELKPANSCGKVTCEPNWKWDTTGNPLIDFDLWYVWEGEGSVSLNGDPYSAHRGACFLFRPGDRTSARHNPYKPLIVSYIHFRMEMPDDIALSAHCQEIEDKLVFEMLLDRYVQCRLARQVAYEHESKLLLRCLLFQWVRCGLEQTDASGGAKKGRLNAVMNEVANFIRQHPGEHHCLTDLADRARLSQRYFSSKFKEIIGMTPEQFIIRSKIDRAEHLLRFTGMSVSQVAEALGYTNIHFFSRQFKQYRGAAPSKIAMKM